MAETQIPWLENAAFGLESCLPLAEVERIDFPLLERSVMVSNADCYLDWLHFLAPRIESYIEANKIKGNIQHERVLQRFVGWCERFTDFSKLTPERHPVVRNAYLRASRLLGAA